MSIDYSDPVDVAAVMAEIAAPLGGMRLQYGTFVLSVTASNSDYTVTFPEAFSSAPHVFCTVIDAGAVGSGSRKDRWGSGGSLDGGTGSTTGFTFRSVRATGTANVRVNWIAIGPA